MWPFSRRAPCAQDSCTYAHHTKDLPHVGSMTACAVASIAACVLVFSAAAQNVAYAYGLGAAKGEFAAYVLAAVSLGASILGPCAWLVVFGRRVPIGTRLVALLLAMGCLTYASVCSLGYVHGARTGAVSGQVAAADAYADARALKRAAIAELATLKGQGPDVLKRRRELAAIVSAPSPTKAIQPGASDAQASAIAFYVQAAGYQVSDGAVGIWLSLGMVAFLELAAALSLTVANALRPMASKTAPEARTEAPAPQATHVSRKHGKAATDEIRRPSDDDSDTPKPRGRGGRPSAVSPETAVARLRKAGGQANGSIARVGRLLGVRSKSTAHRLLNRLSEAGQVDYRATPRGVSVALV